MTAIFLADDHTIVREGLRLLLETQPDLHIIGEAANGRDALHQMTERCPDIAILDIVMPELNGIGVIQPLHQTCPTTQVIMLSMHVTKPYVMRALQAGARGYLLKAAAGKEVIKAVQTVQAGEIYLCQAISDRLIEYYVGRKQNIDETSLISSLSPREREILQLVVEGKSSTEIGRSLSLSSNTVDTYRSRLMKKLGFNNLPSLVKFAIREGLIALDG